MQDDTFVATDDGFDEDSSFVDAGGEPTVTFSDAEPAERNRTTVITIGLTPPIIGGGLALGYLAVRRMTGSPGAAGVRDRRRRATDGAGIGQAAGNVAGSVGDGAGQLAGGVAGVAGGVVEGAANVVGGFGQTAGRVAVSIGDTAGQVTGQVRQRATTVAGTVGSGASRLPEVVAQNAVLALGIGLGIGAAIGLLIPPTRREREVIAPASAELLGRVRTTAQETAEKVQLVAEEAGTTIRQSAEQAGLIEAG
ncbi:MAG: hypothetical protein ABR509_01145 [Candidatus Limnocylindria bacterium]